MFGYNFSAILAYNVWYYISGKDDENFPWGELIPEDVRWFRENTKNKICIMGYKTFETLDKPLVNRLNIVFTRDRNLSNFDNVVCVDSPMSLFNVLQKENELSRYDMSEIMVIGGKEIYNMFSPIITKLYITEIKNDSDGKYAFNDSILNEGWKMIYKDERLSKLSFKIYEKNHSLMFKF